MKKSLAIAIVCSFIGTTLSAQVDLDLLSSDFGAFMTGTVRDLAPSIPLTSQAGELVADSSIDGFLFYIPGVGVTLADKPGRILRNNAYNWQFGVELPSLINSFSGINIDDYNFAPLPTLKLGIGIGLGDGFDLLISGFYIDRSWVPSILGSSMPANTTLFFDSGTIALKLRKAMIRDDGNLFDLSVGIGYTYAGSHAGLGINFSQDISLGNTLDLDGLISFTSYSHAVSIDLQASKKWEIFTPFVKLSGIFSSSTVEGAADINAQLGVDSAVISHHPSATSNSTSLLLGFGFDLTIIHISALIDLGRAYLDIQDFSMTGINGNGIAINAGLRFQL